MTTIAGVFLPLSNRFSFLFHISVFRIRFPFSLIYVRTVAPRVALSPLLSRVLLPLALFSPFSLITAKTVFSSFCSDRSFRLFRVRLFIEGLPKVGFYRSRFLTPLRFHEHFVTILSLDGNDFMILPFLRGRGSPGKVLLVVTTVNSFVGLPVTSNCWRRYASCGTRSSPLIAGVAPTQAPSSECATPLSHVDQGFRCFSWGVPNSSSHASFLNVARQR